MNRPFAVLFCALLLVFALSSCRVYPPVYKRVENFRIERIDNDGFKVFGGLVLYNPNKMKVRLNDMLMDVEIDGKHVATAGQLVPVTVKSQSEFSVPLDLTVKPDMNILEILGNTIKALLSGEMNVTLDGVVMIKAYGTKVSIPIHQTEKVDITKLR